MDINGNINTIKEMKDKIDEIIDQYTPYSKSIPTWDREDIRKMMEEYALHVLDEVETYNLYNLQGGDIVTMKQKLQQLRKIIKEEE